MDELNRYSELFAALIREQAKVVGMPNALDQAHEAGLRVNDDGEIISIEPNPTVVLLRLLKCFMKSGNLETLSNCQPLLSELERLTAEIPVTD